MGAFGVLVQGEKVVTLIPPRDLKTALEVLRPFGFNGHRLPSDAGKYGTNPFLELAHVNLLLRSNVEVSRFRLGPGDVYVEERCIAHVIHGCISGGVRYMGSC